MLNRRFAAVLATIIELNISVGCSEQSKPSPPPEAPPQVLPETTAQSQNQSMPQTQTRAAPKPEPLPRELGAMIQNIAQNQFEIARSKAQTYIQKNPLDGGGYFVIGYAYHRQGNHGPAVPYFEKALELSPQYMPAHHFFGECLFLLGKMDASRAQHEAHRAADPTEPDALYGIGLVDLEESKLEVAERRFREALDLYDKMKKANRRLYQSKKVGRARCHARLADVYFAQDNYEAARDELIKTTTISPGTISAVYTLSVVYRRLGEDQLAEETLKRYETSKAQILKRQRGRGE